MMTATALNCPYCHGLLRAGDSRIGCPACGAGYHEACWQANGRRCAVLGCAGSGAGVALAAPAVAAETIAIPPMTANMIKTRSGLVDCPHCHGETVCKVTDTSSCAYCLTQSNLWIGNQIVVCSVCKGRGQITIAPNLSTCPHCQGSTLCKHGAGSRGSCANCIPVQYTVASYSSYTEKYYPEKIILVSGIDKASTMCSLCKGLGRIAVPANAQVCRHCNGSTVCQRGIGANISCQSCVTATRGKTKVPMEGPQRTMCSICDGLSFLTD